MLIWLAPVSPEFLAYLQQKRDLIIPVAVFRLLTISVLLHILWRSSASSRIGDMSISEGWVTLLFNFLLWEGDVKWETESEKPVFFSIICKLTFKSWIVLSFIKSSSSYVFITVSLALTKACLAYSCCSKLLIIYSCSLILSKSWSRSYLTCI